MDGFIEFNNQNYKDVILQNLLEALIVTDKDKKILFCNKVYSDLSGYSSEELKNKSYIDLIEYKDIEKIQEISSAANLYETVHKSKDGRRIDFQVKSIPLLKIKGNDNCYAYILKDITEYKVKEKEIQVNSEKISQFAKHLAQAHDQLLDAKIGAEAANKAKSIFLANMSHELRSPLGSIIGFSEIIHEEDELPREEIKDMAGVIFKCGKNLLELLNEILDLSKIEAGKILLEKRSFDLEDMILHTLNLLEVRADEKNLSLKCEYDQNLPPEIITDEVRLRQILINLIGNAIKFTEKGYVKLSCKPWGNKNFALFSITDTGIGIEADKLKIIFEPFVQADKSTTRKYGGTGLGLTITEKLITVLGGKIWIESEPGVGTTFYFTLPLTATPGESIVLQGEIGEKNIVDEEITEEPVSRPEKLRDENKILICDDDKENCSLLNKCLTDAGYSAIIVHNGEEALNIVKKESIDFIIMDIRMPGGISGIETTKRIRELSGGVTIPVIACTASAIEDDLEEFVDAGFDDYIIKPVDRNELLRITEKFIG